jgi:hypothetical protein
MKHTPGPWQLEDADPNEEFEIFVPAQPCGRYNIATVCYGYDEPFESQQHANAKLIAAAPEMLDALKKARHWLEGWASAETEISLLDRVIAKAE